MSRKRLDFDQWCDRVRYLAAMMREGKTSRQMHTAGDGIMRHAYALVCHIASHPGAELLPADYETYYERQLARLRKYNTGPRHRHHYHSVSNENLLRYSERPAWCGEARWRMHLDWRKRRKHYLTIPDKLVVPVKEMP